MGAFQLIDEPTNHLDDEGRQRLADYLKRKQGFIVVSHDRDFLNQVIDHVIAIDRAQITSLHGNYTTWQPNANAKTSGSGEPKKPCRRKLSSYPRPPTETKLVNGDRTGKGRRAR